MTVTATPHPTVPAPVSQDPDTLIAETIPWLSSEYSIEAAAFLASKGYTPEQIRDLTARAALEA
jgi:hypothetical protein